MSKSIRVEKRHEPAIKQHFIDITAGDKWGEDFMVLTPKEAQDLLSKLTAALKV